LQSSKAIRSQNDGFGWKSLLWSGKGHTIHQLILRTLFDRRLLLLDCEREFWPSCPQIFPPESHTALVDCPNLALEFWKDWSKRKVN
jgi:hypothetical protein